MVTRRTLLCLLAGFAASPALAGDHPSLVFMRQFGREMLAANKAVSANKFANVIKAYADVPGISVFSLGQYKADLSDGMKVRYYTAVANFMARYFSDQSKEYRVERYEIGEPTVDADKNVIIASKIFLEKGSSYTVSWQIKWINGRYKVADVKVLGFSLTHMQRGIFTSFLTKRKGNISELVVALNRS